MPAPMLQLLAAHIAEPHLMSSRAALQPPTWSAYLPMNSSHTLDYRSQQDAQTFHRATLPARCDPAEILVCLHAGDNSRRHTRNQTCRQYHRYRQYDRLYRLARMNSSSRNDVAVEQRHSESPLLRSLAL